MNALMGFAMALVFAQDPTLSMDEAVSIAMQNAFAVRNAEIQARKADDQYRATKGSTGPTIDVLTREE